MAEKKPPNEEPDNVEDVATEAEDAKEAKATAEEKPKAKPKAKPRAKKADADEATEEKPKPKPRKKAAPKDAPAEEPAAEEAADDDEPPADDAAKPADDDAKPAEEAKPKRRRRGAAEVTAGEARKPAARRDQDGKVIVRAKARYVRCAPRKARLVVDHIRGKSVDEARAILIHTPRAASRDVLKLLDSAIANAENNHELVADELKIDQCFVDEGPTLKRFRPRALGRATRIRKRTSHMTILLTPKE